MECCIDIRSYIVAAKGWRTPRSYADCFAVLGENGILPPDFVPTACQMAQFRNRLVHLYWEVSDEAVCSLLQTHRADFDRFAAYILA
ncbi:MAG: type VII toxin-antitoxin system HepT family RNase toxin [Anaerolineae bacterium]